MCMALANLLIEVRRRSNILAQSSSYLGSLNDWVLLMVNPAIALEGRLSTAEVSIWT